MSELQQRLMLEVHWRLNLELQLLLPPLIQLLAQRYHQSRPRNRTISSIASIWAVLRGFCFGGIFVRVMQLTMTITWLIRKQARFQGFMYVYVQNSKFLDQQVVSPLLALLDFNGKCVQCQNVPSTTQGTTTGLFHHCCITAYSMHFTFY